ncbi:hypothetical protein CASFOL_025750 [Castilleja foliolosa]|uniref:Ataxin 2 SM domain-containing protein n=1 Tax=Castilleja foliolosa TaxID=1961234 RepID=A0ABD3CS10_9LAMI
MACRKEELREERRNRNAAAASSIAMSDALLLTTMCIIGMPVDVYAKDGSVYSGIFHTASVDKDYAIVLKKATMTKKGNLDSNIVNGTLIETLVVGSEDLVQVVAKGVQIPFNGITGYVWGDDLNDAEEDAKHCELKGKKTHKIQSRQVGDDLQEMLIDCHNNPEFQENKPVGEATGASLSITSCKAQSTAALNIPENTFQQEPKGVSFGSYSSLEDQDQRRPSDDIVCRVASPPNGSVASIPVLDFKSESCLSTSSNPILCVPPKGSSVERTAKESKLNPGAKTFSPSGLRHRTVTPPVVPNRASVSYCTVAPEEIDASSFARSSVPVKFVPYNNMVVGHGGNGVPYLQPIIGQVVNRTHPIRYTGQHQNFQTGPASYVHPNPQNIMFGRGGPHVRMQPISSDVQTAVGLSPATLRPMLTPHQVHLPKYQGNASAQALQLCMNPPVMANGPRPFVMSTSIPISQPVFPILRPIAIPGSNGFYSSKFA